MEEHYPLFLSNCTAAESNTEASKRVNAGTEEARVCFAVNCLSENIKDEVAQVHSYHKLNIFELGFFS